ncbi:MAG: rhodanese-like domain-containing protein [Candidatus Methylomirabilia bacterium]
MKPNKTRIAGAVILAAVFLAGWAAGAGPAATATTPRASVQKTIDDKASTVVADARKLMESRKDLLLIDVRSPQEFAQGAIAGSKNIPFIDIMEGRHSLPKDKPVLLICSIGGRSFAAVQLLQEKGYTEVYNLDGGIQAWSRASLPLQTSK